VPAITAACREEEIARWLDQIPQPYEEEHARWYVGQSKEGWTRGDAATFAVTDAESGEVVGSIGVRIEEPDQAVAEVGYWVKSEARRRGVATRALRLATRWLIEDVGLARVQLRADVLNVPSQRVAENAGFTREGVLRSSRYNARQQRRVDFVMYSLLPGELPA
jgi:RimJ/RimL family protein N-acetyltransferase